MPQDWNRYGDLAVERARRSEADAAIVDGDSYGRLAQVPGDGNCFGMQSRRSWNKIPGDSRSRSWTRQDSTSMVSGKKLKGNN